MISSVGFLLRLEWKLLLGLKIIYLLDTRTRQRVVWLGFIHSGIAHRPALMPLSGRHIFYVALECEHIFVRNIHRPLCYHPTHWSSDGYVCQHGKLIFLSSYESELLNGGNHGDREFVLFKSPRSVLCCNRRLIWTFAFCFATCARKQNVTICVLFLNFHGTIPPL